MLTIFIITGIVAAPIIFSKISDWFFSPVDRIENNSFEEIASSTTLLSTDQTKERSEQGLQLGAEEDSSPVPVSAVKSAIKKDAQPLDKSSPYVLSDQSPVTFSNKAKEVAPKMDNLSEDGDISDIDSIYSDCDVEEIEPLGKEVAPKMDNLPEDGDISDIDSIYSDCDVEEDHNHQSLELLNFEKTTPQVPITIEAAKGSVLVGLYKGQSFKYFPEKRLITTDTELGVKLYKNELLGKASVTQTINGKFIFTSQENGVIKALPGSPVKELVAFHEGLILAQSDLHHQSLIGVEAHFEFTCVTSEA